MKININKGSFKEIYKNKWNKIERFKFILIIFSVNFHSINVFPKSEISIKKLNGFSSFLICVNKFFFSAGKINDTQKKNIHTHSTTTDPIVNNV